MEYQSQNSPNNPWKTASIIWGIVAVALSFVMIVFNSSPMVMNAGFFVKSFAFLVGAVLGLGGALIGEAIRLFALPDGFFTQGGMGSILKTKLFWMMGPQCIGVFIGVALGIGIVLQ